MQQIRKKEGRKGKQTEDGRDRVTKAKEDGKQRRK